MSMRTGLRAAVALGGLVLAVGVLAPAVAQAAVGPLTLTVDSTADTSDASPGDGICRTSGNVCTLRAAIQEANAVAGPDTIQFAIGSGHQQIHLAGGLTITSPVVIDGTTQPGFAGQPLIELTGGSGSGLTIAAGGSTIRGLIINSFANDGITITSGDGNVVEGCYIGTNADGSQAAGNAGRGVAINTNDNRIGGRDKAQRNVISGNTGKGNDGGVWIGSGGQRNIIQGNFIGTDATGMTAMGNEGRGVAIHNGSNNYIGGAQPGAGNLVAANRATGIRVIQGQGNQIIGNWIGTNAAGQINVGLWPDPGILSNARGVQLRDSNNTVAANLIAGNTYDGVLIWDGNPTGNQIIGNVLAFNGFTGIGAYYGSGNRFSGNSIFDNAVIGIELGPNGYDGVTVNDALDTDSGTNNLQNYPRIDSATASASQTTVSGVLNSAPNQAFTAEFFANPTCDPSGFGEGKYPLGTVTLATNASGAAPFGVIFSTAIPSGWFITATATDSGNNTSEFSRCAAVR